MIKWLKNIFCIHKWEEGCSCGNSYMQYCPQRKKYGKCTTFSIVGNNYFCNFYYKKCLRCGKEILGWNQ